MKKFSHFIIINCFLFILVNSNNAGDTVYCSIDGQTCAGCALGFSSEVQNLFTYVGQSCYVTDCSQSFIGNKLNGWVCTSCSQISGTDLTSQGIYFDGTNCVDDCPQGQYANPLNGNNCQVAIPGQLVDCSIDKSSCYQCGIDKQIQQFTFDNQSMQCFIIDCALNASIYLNGWVCNSCSTATGSNILKGKYYDGKSCVDSCPLGQSASLATQFVCSPPPNPGRIVGCSTDQSTCKGCASKLEYLRLFTFQSGNNCSVIDCHSTAISIFLNGWVCNSCSQATGNGNIPTGKYFDGKTCVTDCPPGYSASASTGYVCYKNPQPTPCSSDSSTCAGCGDTVAIQKLFTYTGGNTCTVTDCSTTAIGSNLNGWVCNSCSAATGVNLIPNSPNYNGKSCMSFCGTGYVSNKATGFRCQKQNPGVPVACGDTSACGGCGSASDVQKLFIRVKGNNVCSVIDCSSNIIGSNLNGWICNSCQAATGTGNIAQGQYFDGTNCVTTCPNGSSASLATGFACMYPPSPGASVACSSDSSTCGGCGSTNAIKNLFTHGNGSNCSVNDCNLMVVGSNLNGWVCNSCSSASGARNIAKGQYYNGSTCVDSCPPGQQANAATGFVCQNIPNPGIPVTCSNDSSSCGGCGQANAIQNLFAHATGNSCSVVDCTATVIGSNLNGWVCNSCKSANGTGNITQGQYFNGTTCVANCPSGQQASASTGYVCQPIPNSGSAVSCSSDASTCGGCGQTSDIQKLFTHGTLNKCSVTDCSTTVVGSNLNGWVCNSCSTITGKNNIATGQHYNGTTCVSSCPNGQSSSEATGFVCQTNSGPAPVNNNSSQSSLISYTLIFTILKILV
ncbi:hypothetical protein ABPG72_007299 [Tetrahymena utriculariae]